MRRTRRVLVVVAAAAALALAPLSTATASPAGAHPTAMGSITLGTPACC
jgi:hypothetical protein